MIDKNLSYKITDSALIHVASLERNISTLNQSEIASRFRHRVMSESVFDDLFAINSLIGMNLTLGDIKKISIGRDIDTKESKILSNIRQVFDFIGSNFKKTPLTFNFHLIQHVVKLLQTGVLEVWDVGKIRVDLDGIDKTYELSNQQYMAADVSNVLAEAIIWVEEENNVHPIVKACVFMMFINNLSPFVGLNFISSVVFFRLILEKYSYCSDFNIPIFKIFNSKVINLKSIMNSALDKNSNTGLTEVITTVTELFDHTIEYHKKQLVQFDYFDIKTSTEKLDLNDRQLKLLKLLQQKIFIKRKEYIKLFKVSPMTAYRDLNFLVEKKLTVVSGQGKSTTYTLTTKA